MVSLDSLWAKRIVVIVVGVAFVSHVLLLLTQTISLLHFNTFACMYFKVCACELWCTVLFMQIRISIGRAMIYSPLPYIIYAYNICKCTLYFVFCIFLGWSFYVLPLSKRWYVVRCAAHCHLCNILIVASQVKICYASCCFHQNISSTMHGMW